MRSEDDVDLKPVYADLSQQHVTPHERTLHQHGNSVAIRNEPCIFRSTEEVHIERPNVTTSPANPSWAEWELDHNEGDDQTRGIEGDFTSTVEAIEAFMNSDDSSSESANIKVSTSGPFLPDDSGGSQESVAVTSATSRKKSDKKQARKTEVGNGVCPPPPERALNEDWTDPDDIAEFFPKTAHYKTPAGIRFSSQYLIPSKWEREKENYIMKIDYWTGVLKSGKVTQWKDMERIQQLLRQLHWLLANIWDGDMASAVPPEMLWRARKEEMRRLEQFLSRKCSLIESVTTRSGGGRPAGQARRSSKNRSKIDSGNNATLGERNVALFLVLFDRRRWSEVAKKMRLGNAFSDAIERYCIDVESVCRKIENQPEPSDLQRCSALLGRGQALRERLKASGLEHLCKEWNSELEVQQAGPDSRSSTSGSYSSPYASSPTTSVTSTSKRRRLSRGKGETSPVTEKMIIKPRRIPMCLVELEKFANRVPANDRLKEHEPQMTESGLEQPGSVEEVIGSSQSKCPRKRALTVEPNDVMVINERPKRTKKPPARFRLVDEFVSEGLPRSKRNKSPVSVEKTSPKHTIQMKATVDEERTINEARRISSSGTKSSETAEEIVVISEKVNAVGDLGRDVCDDIKVVNNNHLIEIRQMRECRRDKGGMKRVLSYIAHFENNMRQRVTKRIFEKWLERKEKDKNDIYNPNANSDTSSVIETMIGRIKVMNATDIKMENVQESEVQNHRDIQPDGEKREGYAAAEKSNLGQEQNNVSGETADGQQTVKLNDKQKFSEEMFHYEAGDAKGGVESCTVLPTVSTEEQNMPSIPNTTQEIDFNGDIALNDADADGENISSLAHHTSSVYEPSFAAHSRSESLFDSDNHDVKLNNQHDYLLMRSESAFVDSLSQKWMNVPLNGNYNAHVEHIKKLIVALEVCLNDPMATWNDYFGQKEIVQATIESLLTRFNVDRLVHYPQSGDAPVPTNSLGPGSFLGDPPAASGVGTTAHFLAADSASRGWMGNAEPSDTFTGHPIVLGGGLHFRPVIPDGMLGIDVHICDGAMHDHNQSMP